MKIAIQAPKTITLIGFTVLAAAIGFYGFTQNGHASPDEVIQVHTQKPQVTQIQKQVQPQEVLSGEKHYTVQPGDSYSSITTKFKPKNVDVNDYIVLLKNINSNVGLHTSQNILIPTDEDLKNVMLPDVSVLFEYDDIEVINHIKEAEGSKEFQSKNKRRLLGGNIGYPYRNHKFYPYKDIKGNYTIGYGHYLGRKDSDAIKYRNGISSTEAHNLLLKDMKQTHSEFVSLLQKRNAVNLSKEQQRILYEMAFTMGIDKLNRFNGLWKSVKNQNDNKFKKEIKNSLWYRQVGERGELLLSSL